MADPIIIAEKRVQAQHELDQECKALAGKLGIDAPTPLMPIPKQSDMRELQNTEAITDFVKRVSVAVSSKTTRHQPKRDGNPNTFSATNTAGVKPL